MSRMALLSALFAPALVASLEFQALETSSFDELEFQALESESESSLSRFISEHRKYQAAEAEDRNFLVTQWRALESDILKLQQEIAVEESHSSGFLQIRTTPVTKVESSKAENKPKEKGQAGKIEPKEVASPQMDRLAATERMMKGLTGKAMLAPMLSMLKGMYDDQKKRIGDINKKEQKSKERFAMQKAEFDHKTQETELKHDKHKLSDEFFKNETRDYTRQFKYWEGVRSRNHRQFHNALKITHGMMQREKDMIAQYEAALSMKIPQESNAKKVAAPAKPEESPEVVFVQQRQAALVFIQETLAEVRQQLVETISGNYPLSIAPL